VLALVERERGEELAVELLRQRAHLRQHLPSLRRHDDDLATAVLRIAAALDEACFLELVEQADELPAVVAERIGDRALGLALALGERREDRVVLRVDAGVGVGLVRLFLRLHAEALQEEKRGGDQRLGDLVLHDAKKCSASYG